MEESIIWTEKYRPKSFSEVKGQEHIVERLEAFVKQKNMPHLLFAGPPGIGKSTLALVIARELFNDTWKDNFLELNASDERGIDVVRIKVKDFARTKAIGDVPFKIIFLDECDALTREAQQALRRTMENSTRTCRFILSCVTPDTKIVLSNEREIMIKDFISQYEHDAKDIYVQNFSDNRKCVKNDLVLAAVRLPASSIGKRVIEITTKTGRKIKVTDDHKILTISGWKETGNITKEDRLLIYPNLEGTLAEDNSQKIIEINEFIKYLSNSEKEDGLKTIEKAKKFRELATKEKEIILSRIDGLRKIIKENKGLTEREFEVYTLVKENHSVTRESLQFKLGLTRMGINYLLSSLEKKNYIKRIRNKKTHSFVVCSSVPMLLRNDAHIKKIIEREFNVKISYTTVKKSIDSGIYHGRVDRVIGELKRKNLLDITYNDTEKIGALARVCGFMIGDGHLLHNKIRLHFSGNREALINVQKDLDVLEYPNYSKIRSVTIKNRIKKREILGTSTSFTLDARSMSLLLQFLGIPKGDKSITSYYVPDFIKNGTKFVKREFIRALFGCDADKPSWKKMNFAALSLRQNKAKSLKKEMIRYLKEISNILREFDIQSYITVIDKKEIRKRDERPVLTFNCTITPNNVNLQKYFSRIGYAYEDYKNRLARISSEYLRHKLHLVEIWKQKGKLAVALVNDGCSGREAARRLGIAPDYVFNQIKGKEVHLPRKEFISVDKWIEKYMFNDLLIINEIESIEKCDEDVVMDITCHNDHNFISNGFISHNCNFPSKIIEPVQSRCVFFKFKPLSKENLLRIIEEISAKEGFKIGKEAKEALYEVTAGDCRKLENILQSSAAVSEEITDKTIYLVASQALPKEIKDIIDFSISGNFLESRKKALSAMLENGLSGLDLIKQIQGMIWGLSIESLKKLEMIKLCGEIEFRMVEGSDEFIQIEALLAGISLISKK